MRKIYTDNPIREQWNMLCKYSYEDNVERYLKKQSGGTPSQAVLSFITESMLQAKSYYDSAENSNLHIKPLLLYYGTVNLLVSVYCLMNGLPHGIRFHGFKIIDINSQPTRIADIKVKFEKNVRGGLHVFSSLFSEDKNLADDSHWSLLEILGSIPDLSEDFEDSYKNELPNIIPVEIIKEKRKWLYRVDSKKLVNFKNADDIYPLINNFNKYFLPPQIGENYHIIRRKIFVSNDNLGIFSITGRMNFALNHNKNVPRFPSLIILYLAGLYALGTISRYNPEVWNKFIKKDITGERHVIEKFLNLCFRHVPMLTLETILSERICFLNEIEGVIDRSAQLSKEEIEEIVIRKMKEIEINKRLRT